MHDELSDRNGAGLPGHESRLGPRRARPGPLRLLADQLGQRGVQRGRAVDQAEPLGLRRREDPPVKLSRKPIPVPFYLKAIAPIEAPAS